MAAGIKQAYVRMRDEIDRLQREVQAAEENIENYRNNTVNMDWRGDAAEAVLPTIDAICTDIKKLRTTIDNFKREAASSAERMEEQSAQNVKDISSVKSA